MVEHREIIASDLDSVGRGNVYAGDEVIRLDRQFPPTSIRNDRELDTAGPPVVQKGIEGGSDGPAGVQDIIEEDDAASGNIERNVAGADERVG